MKTPQKQAFNNAIPSDLNLKLYFGSKMSLSHLANHQPPSKAAPAQNIHVSHTCFKTIFNAMSPFQAQPSGASVGN